jgi:hypothetical protein
LALSRGTINADTEDVTTSTGAPNLPLVLKARSVRILSTISAAGSWLFVLTIILIYTPRDDRLAAAAVGCLVLIPLCWRSNKVRFWVDERGVHIRNFWRWRDVAWSDLSAVRCRTWWCRLPAGEGDAFFDVLEFQRRDTWVPLWAQATARVGNEKDQLLAALEEKSAEYGFAFDADTIRKRNTWT